ncbi:hypothetical protein BV898_17160 [Hypsibius exemplaris]|uniref:Uncharacterized protein n=1 Tax=Hypsibius exemplaris TaxID=2072580 RepID=A0A9X6RLV6_HYPEX|nr:hypothetical protein BV898_17160 [Hypsibius exemplaris]
MSNEPGGRYPPIMEKVQKHRVLRLASTVGFVVFLCLLVIDLGDWLVNAENGSGEAPDSIFRAFQGRQSGVIVMLAYFRSQFPFLMATLVMLTLFFRAKRICHTESFREQVDCRIKRMMMVSDGTRTPTELDVPDRKAKIATLIVTALASLIFFRLVVCVVDPLYVNEFQYFVWTFPAGYFLVIQVAIIVADSVILPLYLWLFFITIKTVKVVRMYNIMIQSFTGSTLNQCGLVPEIDTNKREDDLQSLCLTENLVAGLLHRVDQSFRTLTGFFLLGNILQLASVISQGFMSYHSSQSNVLTKPIGLVLYVMSCIGPFAAIYAIVMFSAAVHDQRMTSIRLWKELALAHNDEKQLSEKHEYFSNRQLHESGLGKRLLTIMHVTSHRCRGLTVAGTVYITKSFGITLIMGAVGFLCFMLERSEHYDADKAGRPHSPVLLRERYDHFPSTI